MSGKTISPLETGSPYSSLILNVPFSFCNQLSVMLILQPLVKANAVRVYKQAWNMRFQTYGETTFTLNTVEVDSPVFIKNLIPLTA